MKAALELLRLCTTQFPPEPGKVHTLTLDDDRLMLTLMGAYEFDRWHLEESDLMNPPAEMVATMVRIMDHTK